MIAPRRVPRAKERKHLQIVFTPLLHSIRGQLFLINLADALQFLDPPSLLNAFQSVRVADAKRMHEADYLSHLKGVLQRPTHRQLLRNLSASYDAFAADKWVVNVLPYVSYKTYYEDSVAALSGHVPFDAAIGTCATTYKEGSSTAAFWWIAPRSSFPRHATVQSEAQTCRDILGLVHYDDLTPLVAMHIKKDVCRVFRPTVVEANPNARFRQIDPSNPTETRWGRTVNLEKLGNQSVGGEIGGLPELAAERINLSDSTEVSFYYLGKPQSDRSTTSMDQKFLEAMLRGREATAIKDKIIEELLI